MIIVLILHVLGACVVVASAIFAVIITFRQPIKTDNITVFRFIGRFGLFASIWQFITGLILYVHEWHDFNAKPLFWVKIALYVLEGIMINSLITKRIKKAAMASPGQPLPVIKGLSATVLVWALMIVAIASIGVLLVES